MSNESASTFNVTWMVSGAEGFQQILELKRGATFGQVFRAFMPIERGIKDYRARLLNRTDLLVAETELKEGDQLSLTPLKIEGA